jgi:hypothetical protein
MFHRITIEEWHNILTTLSFSLFFTVFIFVLLRVFAMPKALRSKQEHMPLLDDEKPTVPRMRLR